MTPRIKALLEDLYRVQSIPKALREEIGGVLADSKVLTFEQHAEWLKRKVALQGDLDEPAAMGGTKGLLTAEQIARGIAAGCNDPEDCARAGCRLKCAPVPNCTSPNCNCPEGRCAVAEGL